jgi:predicted metalloprotease with PDZ domain
VPFGFVIRDGGEAVRFFVDPARPLADYLGDWTATHEFAHLLLPYVRGSEKWVSEGFASYYQNVLLARRGVYTGTDAWRRLHRSFGKAARIADPPPLSRIDGRPFWEVRMLIYWSGAALALEADTRLRAASGGRESLDSALARLSSCCLPSDRVWRARELFEKLDSLVATPLFVELYESYSKRRGMPDLDPLFEELGIRAEDDQVRLTGQGRLTWVRDAIMAGTPGA